MSSTPPTTLTYHRIKDFERVYIISQNAAVKRWSYVPFPINFEGEGYNALVERGKDGLFALGVFKAIVDVAANMPVKGHLWDHDGPVGARKLSRITRIPVGLIQEAMAILADDGVKWLLEVEGPPAGYGQEPATSTSQPDQACGPQRQPHRLPSRSQHAHSTLGARSQHARSALEPEQQRTAAAEIRTEQNQQSVSVVGSGGAERGGERGRDSSGGTFSAAAGPLACTGGAGGDGVGWRTPYEALAAIGVGEPLLSDLAGSTRITVDLVAGEWDSIRRRKGIVDPRAALTASLMRHAGIHKRSEGQAASRRVMQLRAEAKARTA